MDLKEIQKLAQQLGKKTEETFSTLLSDEIMSKLTPEQRATVVNANKAFDFSSIDLSKGVGGSGIDKKIEDLQNQLKQVDHVASTYR